jgi:hypothetical protein
MDGLSAAASGIAVVSFAIQLVDAVREIRLFLRKVSNAPKELRRLIDLLEQLELILGNIGMLIKRQQKQSGHVDVDISPDIWRAVSTCKDKVDIFQGTLETTKKAFMATNKTTRTLGCFRLAYKMRDIVEFEGQLQSAISLLNLTMTTNLT